MYMKELNCYKFEDEIKSQFSPSHTKPHKNGQIAKDRSIDSFVAINIGNRTNEHAHVHVYMSMDATTTCTVFPQAISISIVKH